MKHEMPGVISDMEVQTIVGWVSEKPEPYLSACAVIAGMAAVLAEETNVKDAARTLRVIADEVADHADAPIERDPQPTGGNTPGTH